MTILKHDLIHGDYYQQELQNHIYQMHVTPNFNLVGTKLYELIT